MSKSPEEIASVLLDFDSVSASVNIRHKFQEPVNVFFTKPAGDADFDSDWEDENEIEKQSEV